MPLMLLPLVSVTGVNYFGYWLSALDANNVLELRSRGSNILEFTAEDVLRLVEGRSAYFGHPNKQNVNRNEP